jgi:hypothetical protein
MAALVVLAAFSPATQEKAAPVPSGAGSVPITVRVFDGKRFVSGLTLEDFEIEEVTISICIVTFFETGSLRTTWRQGRYRREWI